MFLWYNHSWLYFPITTCNLKKEKDMKSINSKIITVATAAKANTKVCMYGGK